MESIGEKFKKRREERGLFVEQIARDTNISKKYIDAIESEDFSEMPGEAYLIGFLRSYAEYLDIDPEEIIAIYKNTKIQEQPVPEELIPQKKTPFSALVIITVAVLAVTAAGIGGFLLLGDKGEKSVEMVEADNNAEKAEEKTETSVTGSEYTMSDAFIERRFEEGDVIRVAVEGSFYNIVCSSIDSVVKLSLPDKVAELSAGYDSLFDLTGDKKSDIRIIIRDIDKKGKGAVIKFDRSTEAPSVAASEINSQEELSEVSRIASEVEASASPGDSSLESRKQKTSTILTADKAEPFTLNIVFRGYCLMRYLVDDSHRDERYFHKGETFRLNVNDSVRLWLSNAGSALIDINGQEYAAGKSGQVAAKLIKWNKEAAGKNSIISVPMY